MKKPSKPVSLTDVYLKKFKNGLSVNDIAILTGWSIATLRRRMKQDDFPNFSHSKGRRNYWTSPAILEWVSKFNLKNEIGADSFKLFEIDLAVRSVADQRLSDRVEKARERARKLQVARVARNGSGYEYRRRKLRQLTS
jgi:predicted DNA-binding transcriptional regulator AlpA